MADQLPIQWPTRLHCCCGFYPSMMTRDNGLTYTIACVRPECPVYGRWFTEDEWKGLIRNDDPRAAVIQTLTEENQRLRDQLAALLTPKGVG